MWAVEPSIWVAQIGSTIKARVIGIWKSNSCELCCHAHQGLNVELHAVGDEVLFGVCHVLTFGFTD